jgi:hypothetical protein
VRIDGDSGCANHPDCLGRDRRLQLRM